MGVEAWRNEITIKPMSEISETRLETLNKVKLDLMRHYREARSDNDVIVLKGETL